MKFTDTIYKLQKENEGTVILVKNGIFFVAIGKDAVFLSEKIGLKRTCMKDKLCKVGFSIQSSEKYMDLLEKNNISYKLYQINKSLDEPEVIYSYSGDKNLEQRECIDCTNCKERKETDAEILERLKKKGNM